MKHIFHIHSHVVRAVAEAYVRHAGLPEADCLFYLTRGLESYSRPLPGRIENRPLQNPAFGKVTKIFENWRILKRNARKIGEWMGQQPFITYTPNPTLPISQQLIHHPLCSGYWILEEGVGSYFARGLTSVDLELAAMRFKCLRRIKANVMGMGVIRSVNHFGQVWPHKYHGTVALYPDCFPGYPGTKVILPTPAFRCMECPSFQHLLIMESGIGTGIDLKQDWHRYLLGIQEIVSKVKIHSPGGWAFKFHPIDLENPDYCEQARKLMHKLAFPLTHQELPPSTCLEELGLAPGVTAYCSSSSAGLYIERGGGKVVNVSDVLRRVDVSFLRARDSWPSNLRVGVPFDHYMRQFETKSQ